MCVKSEAKVALVTGGASGMGWATCERLSKMGVTVYAIDLPEPVERAEKDYAVAPNIKFRSADVTSEQQVSKVVEEIREAHERLDYVVNCAGVLHQELVYDAEKEKPHDLAAFQRIFEVNVTGTFNVIRLAIPLMLKTQPSGPDGQRGVIINNASVSRSDGPAGILAYAASKAAVTGMTVPLAKELGSSGIRVINIAPGPVDTPMIANVRGLYDNYAKQAAFPKRVGRVDEFAHLVQSVIENQLINATTIRLDGGFRNSPGTFGK